MEWGLQRVFVAGMTKSSDKFTVFVKRQAQWCGEKNSGTG